VKLLTGSPQRVAVATRHLSRRSVCALQMMTAVTVSRTTA
jgi:hypothetical protein